MNVKHLPRVIIKHKAITGLLLLAVAIGLVNVFVMPPFMNPDEIQHFLFSATYAYSPQRLETLDDDVLQLLKDYKWFHFIGVGPGWEQRFKNIEEIFFIQYFDREKHSVSKTYFHYVYGTLLKLSGIRQPLSALYFMRILSFFIFMGIVCLSIYFYKKYFPGYWFYMMAGQLLLFQPSTILNSVNYDVLLTFLGILFFIFAFRFNQNQEKHNLIFMVALSGMASLIKIGGLLFFVYTFLLLLLKYKSGNSYLKRLPLGLLGLVVVFGWFNFWFPERFYTLYTAIFAKIKGAFALISDMKGHFFNLGFFDSVIDSFYFHTGWMGFKLGAVWYILQKLVLLVAFIGTLAATVSKKVRALPHETQWNIFIVIVILLQMLSIRLYYGSGLTAQGRYLLPLLLPIVVLIFNGLKTIESYFNFDKAYLSISFLFFQVLFFLAALTRVISVFYLEIASPHLGL